MSAPPDPFRGSARLFRGTVVGAACVLLTAGGHAAGGGAAGGLISLILFAPLALALGVAWAEQRRSALAMTAFLLGMQVLLHMLLVVRSGHGGDHSALLPGGTMLTGHALAAAGVAIVLAQGDALLSTWITFLSTLARGFRSLPAIPCFGPMPDVGTRPSTVTAQRFGAANPHRGPPAA